MPNDNWMQRDKKDNNSSVIEIKPEDIQKAMEPKLKEIQTGLSTDLDTKLSPIMEFINNQKKEKEAADAEKSKQQRQQQQDDLEVKPEDFITDPEGSMNKKLTPIVQAVQAQSAMLMREKTLGKMDYYSTDPAFAAKVDTLLDSQPLHMRANAAVILNAYKSVFFDMQQEIKDGKIKSFASQASLSNNGTGGPSSGDKKDDPAVLSADEKAYAKKMGLTEEQWIAGKRELEYV